jgi:hypothetical protein
LFEIGANLLAKTDVQNRCPGAAQGLNAAGRCNHRATANNHQNTLIRIIAPDAASTLQIRQIENGTFDHTIHAHPVHPGGASFTSEQE